MLEALNDLIGLAWSAAGWLLVPLGVYGLVSSVAFNIRRSRLDHPRLVNRLLLGAVGGVAIVAMLPRAWWAGIAFFALVIAVSEIERRATARDADREQQA